jgi:parallel beta-helix repeat protein
MNKLFASLVAAGMLLSATVTSAALAFTDIPSSHWAYEDITLMREKNWIDGYEDGSFRPDGPITRAEAVTMVSKTLKLSVTEGGFPSFSDVSSNHWAFGAITKGHKLGIVSGYPDGSFQPDSDITRAEAAVILDHIFTYQADEKQAKFNDLPSSHWAYSQVMRLAGSQIVFGTGSQMVEPERSVTRAEFSVMLARTVRQEIPEKALIEMAGPDTRSVGATGAAAATIAAPQSASTYLLELDRWGIYKDGTHPVETTQGFNDALQWASLQGYTAVKVPAGKYLIKKGETHDASARINMVSNMTLISDPNAIYQKEPNGYTGYDLLRLGPEVKNAVIQGGTFRGDKDQHNYSSAGTHEWGHGILIEGAENVVVDGVTAHNFTGDGLLVGHDLRYGTHLTAADFEAGSLDQNGNPTAGAGKVRSKISKNTNFEHAIYQELRNLYLWAPTGVSGNTFDIYFYTSDNRLISRQEKVYFWRGEVTVPQNAAYFRVVFQAASTSGVSVYRYVNDLSKNVTVQNSIFHSNRRQGVTVGGADGVTIQNSEMYNIRGIAPQAGIDVEQGYGINRNVLIRNNYIHDNVYGIILYDGEQATVEGNTIKNHSFPGIVSQEGFSHALIQNNTLDSSGMTIKHDATLKNNKVTKGSMFFTGPNVSIDGLTATNSNMDISSSVPFGVTVANAEFIHTSGSAGRIALEGEPITMKNITITGSSSNSPLLGGVKQGSIFDDLKITGFTKGISFPRGTYNRCELQTAPGAANLGISGISREGNYEFRDCRFTTGYTALTVDHAGAEIGIHNSTFGLVENASYSLGLIQISAAKKAVISGNTIDVRAKATKDVHLVRVGRTGWQSKPVNVAEATIQNNTLYADFAVEGISTTGGGTDAPPYTVTGNVLYKAKLALRAKDISSNNSLN